jgi:hypothetical protein
MAVIGLGNIQGMSETPEPSTPPASVAAAPPLPPAPRAKPPRLYTAAAWVVIVAGIMFILSVVFFSGAIIFGHNYDCHRYHHGIFRPGGPGGPWGPPGYGPWQPGEPGGPGGPGWAPSPFPGGPGGPGGPFAGPGPGQSPTTVAPPPGSPAPRT